MKTRRGPEPTLTFKRPQDWPPACVMRRADPDPLNPTRGCKFVGEPNAEQSPYLACYGDPSKHIRSTS